MKRGSDENVGDEKRERMLNRESEGERKGERECECVRE